MSAPLWLRIGGPIALAIAAWLLIADYLHVKSIAAAARACEHALASPADPLDRCGKAISAAGHSARQAATCEVAITADDLFSIRASCGAQVKRSLAELTAANSDRADLQARLALADQERDRAVARAEDRAAATAQRTAENDRTIDAAPTGADGRRHCDAECVRALAGERPAGR